MLNAFASALSVVRDIISYRGPLYLILYEPDAKSVSISLECLYRMGIFLNSDLSFLGDVYANIFIVSPYFK